MALIQAGLSISVKQYWIFSVLFAIFATTIVFLFGKGPFVMAMTAIISFFGIPKFVLRKMTQRRQKKFMADLADVFRQPAAYVRTLPSFFFKHADYFSHFVLSIQFTCADGEVEPHLALLYKGG
jgi:hypothetical protein